MIDVSPLLRGSDAARDEVGKQIERACRDTGFFYVTGHGVDRRLQQSLEETSRRFFAQDLQSKLEISMEKGGRAWRGYFPVGRELTSGRPDAKEGIYFGAELEADHPLVESGIPMHGSNLFPSSVPEMRDIVLEYITSMTGLGHLLMRGIALSLGLGEHYFSERYTTDPLILFRIFNYPADVSADDERWGVGEHTDYGLLTILKQDCTAGLQVKSKSGWIDGPPIEDSFVCNIGDMLDRMTGGVYKSTPHRVRNSSGRDRLSFPFFFDPNFSARIQPIDVSAVVDDDWEGRWDRASVHDFVGTYGEYLLGKVSKVFPELHRKV